MEKDEHEQQVLARIIAERKRGQKLRQIGRILESDGIMCRGGPWYHQTIGAILHRAEIEQGAPWEDHDEELPVIDSKPGDYPEDTEDIETSADESDDTTHGRVVA